MVNVLPEHSTHTKYSVPADIGSGNGGVGGAGYARVYTW